MHHVARGRSERVGGGGRRREQLGCARVTDGHIAAPRLVASKLDPPRMQDQVWNMTNRSEMFRRMGQAAECGVVAFPITRRNDMTYLMNTVYGNGYGAATLSSLEKAAARNGNHNKVSQMLVSENLQDGLKIIIHARNGKVADYTVIVPNGKQRETADFFRNMAMRSDNQITERITEDNQPRKINIGRKSSAGIER